MRSWRTLGYERYSLLQIASLAERRVNPRGSRGEEGHPVGPGLRGARRFSTKGVHVGLEIERAAKVVPGDPHIVIRAYDSGSGLGIHGDLIAEVGPADIRSAIILLSPELFTFFQKKLNP